MFEPKLSTVYFCNKFFESASNQAMSMSGSLGFDLETVLLISSLEVHATMLEKLKVFLILRPMIFKKRTP